jgi:flavorubredoxin
VSTARRDLTMTPYQVADETFVIPWVLAAPPVGLFPMNSLVIRGREPVLVDTGSPANREEWLNNVSSVVDLNDVRWIFLSHDDRDHSGNLMAALEACPNATLLTTWYAVGRMADEWDTPLDRCRFMNDGDVIDIGDRRILAIRPPVFDNPTTRALFDERTGVFWSVDTFATNMREPLSDSADLSQDAFREGQLLGGRLMAAWHPWLDEGKFCAYVQKVQDLPITVIAGGHTPAIRGSRIEEAFGLVRQLPVINPWPEFTQRTLDKWMAAITSVSVDPPREFG